MDRTCLTVERLEERKLCSAVPVGDTAVFPFRAVGQVVSWFDLNHDRRQEPGELFTGTATMIGPHSALTSAHVVYDPAFGGFARAVTFEPGLNGDVAPFRTFVVRSWVISSRFQADNGAGYDLAVLNFAMRVGGVTGFLGVRAFPSQSLSHFLVNNIGYPGETHSGDEQFLSSGLVTGVTATDVRYRTVDIPVQHGSSGSPIYIYILASGERDIVAVHSRRIAGNRIGVGTRITPFEVRFILRAESASGTGGQVKVVS